jgi:hypothetical protein
MFSVHQDLDKIRVERFKQATEAKLRGIRCPEHNQPPRIRFQGDSLRNITVSLTGCCPKLMEVANLRIASPAQREQDQPARANSLRQPA